MDLAGEDVEARLDRLILDCFSIRKQLDAERGRQGDSGNVVERMIANLPPLGAAVALPAYGQIIPGLSLGFEPNKGVKAEARLASHGLAAEIAIDEIGTSGWLTLEYGWSWEAILPKRSVHVLMEASFLPLTAITPKLRYKTITGKPKDISAGVFRLGSASQLLVASIVLPDEDDPDCDFSEPPSVILFLNTVPGLLSFSKLFFW